MLVRFCNETGAGIGVTVHAGGTIVSGTLISDTEFYLLLAERVRAALPDDESAEDFAGGLDRWAHLIAGDDNKKEPNGEKEPADQSAPRPRDFRSSSHRSLHRPVCARHNDAPHVSLATPAPNDPCRGREDAPRPTPCRRRGRGRPTSPSAGRSNSWRSTHPAVMLRLGGPPDARPTEQPGRWP